MRYLVESRLLVDDTYYVAGDTVDMDKDQAEALLAAGVLAPVAGPGAAGDDLSVDDVIAAIQQLDPNNPEHYTKSGKPQTDALSELLGREVTARLRDKAFAQVEK